MTLEEHIRSIATPEWEAVASHAARLNLVPWMVYKRGKVQEFDGYYVSILVLADRTLPYGAPVGATAQFREAPFAVASIDELPRALKAHWQALAEWVFYYLQDGRVEVSAV